MTDVITQPPDISEFLSHADSNFNYVLDNNSGITIVGNYLNEDVFDIDIKYDRQDYDYDLKNLLLSLCCVRESTICREYLRKCLTFIELITSSLYYLNSFRDFVIQDQKSHIGTSKLDSFNGLTTEKTLYKNLFRWSITGCGKGSITIDSSLLDFDMPTSFDISDVWYEGKKVKITDSFMIKDNIPAEVGVIKVIEDDIVIVPEVEPKNILEQFKVSVPKCFWYKFYPVNNIITYG